MMDLSGGNSSFGEHEYEDYKDFDAFSFHFHSLEIILIIVYCLVLVVGVPGNGAVIWVTGFRLKKTTNTVWFLNLAVADFLFAVFLPLTVTTVAMEGHWPFGKFMCKLNYSVNFLTMYASVYFLVVISVDRCVSVAWPVWAQNHRSARKASYVSLGVWVLALAFSTPDFIFMDDEYPHNENITECMHNFAFSNNYDTIARLLLGFVVPFTVIVSCYAVVIRRKRSLAGHWGRPFKIAAAVIAAYFLCWAPYHIMEIIPRNSISGAVVFFMADCLAILNRCLNPLLYVFMGQDFKGKGRKPVLKVLESVFTEEEPPSNPPTNFTISDTE